MGKVVVLERERSLGTLLVSLIKNIYLYCFNLHICMRRGLELIGHAGSFVSFV